MKFRYILAAAFLTAALITSPMSAEAASMASEGTPEAAGDSVHILEGVFADSISLSGLTPAEARQAIDDYYQNIGGSTFTVDVNGQKVTTTLNDLGFTYQADEVISQASLLGQYGGLIQRYKTLMDLKYDKVTLPIPHELDESRVSSFVAERIGSLDTDPVNATITRESGEFIITPHVTGLQTNQESTVQTIMEAGIGQLTTNMEVAATVEVTTPSRTTELLSAIDTVLGDYATDYSSSASGRKTNISVAVDYLNGTLLMPGASLSVSDTIRPREPEYGYAIGGEYVNGETVESYGGGVCQVATTLYNALLEAELEIDERHPHSMLVSYVKPSFDAAIATGSKDLIFTNNTGYPIYIGAYADGATLGFNIYGKEYRDASHHVEYESVVISRETSEDKVVEDPLQPTGFRETKGSNHDKCTSHLVKKVYEDGELVETIEFRTDYYAPSFRTVTVGTGPAESLPIDPLAPDTTPGPLSDPTQPAETETAPAETAAPADPAQ